MSNLRIPPLIEGWLEELNNPKTPDHVKVNRCMMLEEIQKAITASTMTYRAKASIASSSRASKN
jgi:hypothetical protein